MKILTSDYKYALKSGDEYINASTKTHLVLLNQSEYLTLNGTCYNLRDTVAVNSERYVSIYFDSLIVSGMVTLLMYVVSLLFFTTDQINMTFLFSSLLLLEIVSRYERYKIDTKNVQRFNSSK